jgi:hypothetical protein
MSHLEQIDCIIFTIYKIENTHIQIPIDIYGNTSHLVIITSVIG